MGVVGGVGGVGVVGGVGGVGGVDGGMVREEKGPAVPHIHRGP